MLAMGLVLQTQETPGTTGQFFYQVMCLQIRALCCSSSAPPPQLPKSLGVHVELGISHLTKFVEGLRDASAIGLTKASQVE